MNIALIVAGGIGKRLGMDTPKQFLKVNNKPIIVYTLEKFEKCDEVDQIIVVTLEQYIEEVKSYKEKYHINKLSNVVLGDRTRQLSTYNGLLSIKDKESIVLIHDAARPLVSVDVIKENIKVAKENGNAITACKVNDTMMQDDKYLKREELVTIQTPQTFKYELILKAHQEALKRGIDSSNDDSYLVKLLENKLFFVESDKTNFKVTTKDDLTLLNAILKGE